jgi:tetratricopeptide (TPR) repeat protein
MLLTDEENVQKSLSESNIALRLVREGRLNAGVHFWRALVILDELTDLHKKRNYIMEIAMRFSGLKFYDLALFAIQSAIEIDESLQDKKSLTNDMIAYGNINMNLGNIQVATETYQQIIDICLKNNMFANAASASTNLAQILAQDGNMVKASTLLEQSLEYLEKEPFPNTEITTRLVLINILYIRKVDPDKIIDNAEVLFNCYSDKIPQHTKQMVAMALENAFEQYLMEHPELEAQSWRTSKAYLLNYWRRR